MSANASTGVRQVFSPELLDRCISCGFCLPACPTYARTGMETSSPRGRIDLMRALETGALSDDDATVQEESSFCLGCRACEPVCPAGVQYGALLEEWRDHTWARGGGRRRLRLTPLLWGANRPWRLRAMGLVRRHARGRGGDGPQLMLGCYERALFPRVSRAARALVPALRVDPGQGCCGALHAHNGELKRGRELAEELGRRLDGTILTTAGGCAAHLVAVLGADRVRELSQYLAEAKERPRLTPGAADNPGPGAASGRPRIALQDSCHLRNGMGVFRQPRELIEEVGTYIELPSASECCGAAGTYSILRPSDSKRILDDKLAEIEAAQVDFVVAVNPGCLRQLQTGLKRQRSRVRAVHLAELLADHHVPT
ncbi:MAG: (Fe-S)-binding protein [Solirubrobacterales bacterium]|nr:(Fe-S)-binding protein [Solirubrobacterales bacterium]